MKILRFLKNYKKESLLAPLFKMMEAIFDLLVPLVVARIIDDGIRRGDTTYVLQMGGVLLLLAACGLTFSLTAQFFAAKAAAGFGKELRHSLFDHIQKLSYTQLDNQGTSTLITRMTSDVNLVQTQVNMAIRLLLRSPFIVFGAMIMAFFVDGKTAMVFVVAIPVLSVIVYGIMLITIPLYKKVQSRLDKVMGSTRENLDGVRVIRAFNKQEQEVARYNEENATLEKFQLFAGRISTLMNPATYIVINVATIGILWVGGDRVNTGSLTQGQVVALVNYMSQILVELIKLANLIITEMKAIASKNRVDAILTMEEYKKPKGKDKKCDHYITFENVSLSYNKNNEYSLNNISFTVDKGDTVGIIGGTGSGKTSVMNLLCGFYEPTSGDIILNDKNILNYSDEELNENISVVMQKATMFSGTVKENITFGAKNATAEDIEKAIEISQSKEIISNKSKGLDEVILEQGKNLSGGQKQRLSIARGIVRNTPILILDDSFSALDYKTDKTLRQALADSKGDRTTFIISQRTSTIEHCDKILVLNDGALEGVGTHEELLKSSETYKDIYESCNKEAS